MNDLEIEIHCPDCDAAMNVMLSQIAREETKICPCCRKAIHMRPDPKPGPEDVKILGKSLDAINETMRKLKGKP